MYFIGYFTCANLQNEYPKITISDKRTYRFAYASWVEKEATARLTKVELKFIQFFY